jgi:hypothetical protein
MGHHSSLAGEIHTVQPSEDQSGQFPDVPAPDCACLPLPDYFEHTPSKAVDMEEGYLSIFGLPSHAVHGNWQDLITHHLEYGEGSFTPTTAWTHSRPQTVFGVAMFSVHANLLYARKLLSQSYEVDAIQDILVDLMMRVNTANELHEQFLQNKSEHL